MVSENVMTYEVLYDLLRKEKYSQELQKLDSHFFKSVVKYLGEKSAIIDAQKNKESVFAGEVEKTERQLINVKKLIKEFYEKREGKIMQLALFSSRINEKDIAAVLLPEERQLFLEVLETLNKFRKGIVENVVEKRVPIIENKPKEIKREESPAPQGSDMNIIRLLHPVPQFIANDLKIYGPFEDEDVGVLPKKTADLLVKKKRAEEIKSENSEETHAVLS
ncbi:MAG: hypothetical protein AABW64_03295 [Nanoarchaeota archaeon]